MGRQTNVKINLATIELNDGTEEIMVTLESGTPTTFLANSFETVFCDANDDVECFFQYLLVNEKHWFELGKDYTDFYGDDETRWMARRIYPFEAKERIARYWYPKQSRDFAQRIKTLIAEEILPSDSKLEKHLDSQLSADSHVAILNRESTESPFSWKLAIEHLLTFRHAVSEAIKSNSPDATVDGALPMSSKTFVRNLGPFLLPMGDKGGEVFRVTHALLQTRIRDCDAEFEQFCEVIDDIANSPKTLLNGSVDEATPSMIGDDENAVEPSILDLDSDVGIQNETKGLNSIGGKNTAQSSNQLLEPIAPEKSAEALQELMFDIFFCAFVKYGKSWECDKLWQPKSDDQIRDLKRIILGRDMEFEVTKLESRLTTMDSGLLELARGKPTFLDFKKNYRHLLVAVLWQRTDATWDDCNTIMKYFLNQNYSPKNMRGATSEFLVKMGLPFELRQGEAGKRSSPSDQVKLFLSILRAQSD